MKLYKVTNKECSLYSNLITYIQNGNYIENINNQIIRDHIKHNFTSSKGYRHGVFDNIPIKPYGFFFSNPSELDKKEWRESKNEKGLFVPNRRSAKGKFIYSVLSSLYYRSLLILPSILSAKEREGYTHSDICRYYPQAWLINRNIYIAISNCFDVKHTDVIEITRGELESILSDDE